MVSGISNCDRDFCDFGGVGSFSGLAPVVYGRLWVFFRILGNHCFLASPPMVSGRSLCFRRFWAGGCFPAFSAMVSGILNCDRDFCDFGGREVFFDLSCYGFSWLKGVFSILG